MVSINGVSFYVSDKISLQWIILLRNIEEMLLSEDFLKGKVSDYILHSFEKDEFYLNGVIEWIHKPKKDVLWRRSYVTHITIRKQLNCYKSELHILLNAYKPVNDDTNEM